MKTITVAAAMTLAIASMATSSPANAADLKSFSSMVCRPNGAASLNTISYSHQGIFNTSSTESAVVICPLLNDHENYIPVDGASLRVRAKAPSVGTTQVACNVQVGSLSSGSWSSSDSSGNFSNGSNADLGLPVQTQGASWIYEAINLVCALGPRARLTRIYMTTNEPTQTP